jgi:hypothetical protein
MRAKPGVLGAAIAMLASAPAMADRDLGPLVQASEESPFGPLEACGNFPGEFFGVGVNFLDSELEPWLEVNPIAPTTSSPSTSRIAGRTAAPAATLPESAWTAARPSRPSWSRV